MSRKLSLILLMATFTPAHGQTPPWGMPGNGPGPIIPPVNEMLEQIRKEQALIGNPCPVDRTKMPLGMDYVCDDMAKFSCREGSFTDGTGKSKSTTDASAEIRKLQATQQEKYETALTQFFAQNDSAARSLFQPAMKATGYNLEPVCAAEFANRGVTPGSECYRKVVKSLARAFSKTTVFDPFQFMPTHDEIKTQYDLAALEELISTQKLTHYLKPIAENSLNTIDQKKTLEKVEPIFKKVQAQMIAKIDSWVDSSRIDAKQAQRIKDKLATVEFNGSKCGGSERSLDTMLVPNAYYFPYTKEFRYCNGLLMQGDSEFSLAFVIGHELAHSIDPCSLGLGSDPAFNYTNRKDVIGSEKESPFANVLGCLRTLNSVAALRSDWSKTKGNREQDLKQELEAGTKPPENPNGDNAFCVGDQIGESFADWAAAEMLPDFIASEHQKLSPTEKIVGYSNVMRGLCSLENVRRRERRARKIPNQFDEHAEPEDRINRILMANPKIRAEIGCLTSDKTPAYCDPQKTPAGKRAQEVIEKKIDTQFGTGGPQGQGSYGGGYPPNPPYPPSSQPSRGTISYPEGNP